jgi:CubicO group peptidase (beta-lactamase class C family)
LIALLLVGCSGTHVEPTAIAQAVDELLAPYVKDGRFSGSILIARGEDILVSKGYGMANREHDVPNTPQTKFRLHSVTKQFTAMAILMLQEQGQLSVQDLVCDHVPDCPKAWQPITIHHLLTHSLGIPDYRWFPDYRETMTLESLVKDTLERFSETSYAEYLRENIFEPLSMMNTGYDYHHIVLKDRASGYRRVGADAFWNAAYLVAIVFGEE